MRKAIALLLCACLMIMLSGCDSYDIDSLVSVIGFGIDYDPDLALFTFTAEAVKIPEGNPAMEPMILSGEGETIAAALQDMSTKVGGRLFFQHADILAFGEETMKHGISTVIDTIVRAPPAQRVSQVVVVRDATAAKLFEAKPVEKSFLSEEINEGITSLVNRFGASYESEIHNLYNNIPAGLADLLPAIKLTGEGEEMEATLDGCAVTSEGKLAGYLTFEETKYCTIAMGIMHTGILSMRSSKLDEPLALVISSNRSGNRATLIDGALTMEVTVSIEGTVPDIKGQVPTVQGIKERELTKDIESQLSEEVERVVQKVIGEFGADLFFFKPQVQNRYRAQFREWAQDWDAQYRRTQVRCDTSVIIYSNGITK